LPQLSGEVASTAFDFGNIFPMFFQSSTLAPPLAKLRLDCGADRASEENEG
jgi:hypothetical protein